MKIQCNACKAAAASVLCCSDEAALCLACDERVHTAKKHERVSLLPTAGGKCDICQEASAYFFCLEDRAVLCGQCDVSVHTTNSYVSAHQRFLLTGLRVGLEPFKPVSSLDKEQSESKQKSVETPMDPLPCPNPPLSLSIYTNENISDQVGNGGLAGNELSFSDATMSGTSSGWPSDELFGFTDFNQTYQFTEHALSKGDGILPGSIEGSSSSHSADDEVDGAKIFRIVLEIPWTAPEIPSPVTASELCWLKNFHTYFEAAPEAMAALWIAKHPI